MAFREVVVWLFQPITRKAFPPYWYLKLLSKHPLRDLDAFTPELLIKPTRGMPYYDNEWVDSIQGELDLASYNEKDIVFQKTKALISEKEISSISLIALHFLARTHLEIPRVDELIATLHNPIWNES